MTVIDYIKMELQMAQGWLLPLFEDLANAPFVQPTSNGGNHVTWILGHLAYSDANILHSYIRGEQNPPGGLEDDVWRWIEAAYRCFCISFVR